MSIFLPAPASIRCSAWPICPYVNEKLGKTGLEITALFLLSLGEASIFPEDEKSLLVFPFRLGVSFSTGLANFGYHSVSCVAHSLFPLVFPSVFVMLVCLGWVGFIPAAKTETEDKRSGSYVRTGD